MSTLYITLSELSKATGVPLQTIHSRIRAGKPTTEDLLELVVSRGQRGLLCRKCRANRQKEYRDRIASERPRCEHCGQALPGSWKWIVVKPEGK